MATSNETATYIGDLTDPPTVPSDSLAGGRSRGGAEIRKAKQIMKKTFPNCTGAVSATHTELDYCNVSALGTAEASKAVTVSAGSAIVCTGITWTNLGTVTTVDINGGTLGGFTIDGNWTAASQTCADLGTVTTCDINGGTVNGLTSLGCSTGADITEFSTDGTLAGNSDTAVPTEKAVKTYADSLQAGMTMLTAESVGTSTEKSQALTGTVERIEIAFGNISSGGTSSFRIVVGTGGALDKTGYVAQAAEKGNAIASTTGFIINAKTVAAGDSFCGIMTLTHVGSNQWVASGHSHEIASGDNIASCAGSVTLSGACDIVGIYSSANFDAGTWKVSYQTS